MAARDVIQRGMRVSSTFDAAWPGLTCQVAKEALVLSLFMLTSGIQLQADDPRFLCVQGGELQVYAGGDGAGLHPLGAAVQGPGMTGARGCGAGGAAQGR